MTSTSLIRCRILSYIGLLRRLSTDFTVNDIEDYDDDNVDDDLDDDHNNDMQAFQSESVANSNRDDTNIHESKRLNCWDVRDNHFSPSECYKRQTTTSKTPKVQQKPVCDLGTRNVLPLEQCCDRPGRVNGKTYVNPIKWLFCVR